MAVEGGSAGPIAPFKAVVGKILGFEKRQRKQRPFRERFPETPEYNDADLLADVIAEGDVELAKVDQAIADLKRRNPRARSPILEIQREGIRNNLDLAQRRLTELDAERRAQGDYTEDELYEQRLEFESDAEAGSEEDRRIAVETAPYAVETYRTEFMPTTTRKPRKLPDPPSRLPAGRAAGRAGAAGAIVGGIIELINFGKDYFATEDQRNRSKGPATRPKAKPRKQPAPDEVRVAIERRVEPVATAPVEIADRTATRRREAIGKIEEITVTKQRRALPSSPRTPARMPSLPPIPKPIVIDPLRLLDLIGKPGKSQAKSSSKGPKTERQERDQVSFNPAQANPRAETKQRSCQEESRTRCYKGFYRERARSTAKKKWTEIDCFSGKEIPRG